MKKEYLVRVSYMDLSVENEYTEDRQFMSSKRLYDDLKSKLNVNAYKVELIKVIDNQEFITYSKKKNRIKGEDCRQLVGDILENISKIKKEYDYYNAMLIVYDKRRSSYLHMLERVPYTTFKSLNDKKAHINNINDLQIENENDRRYAKGQLIGLESILPSLAHLEESSKIKKYAEKTSNFELDSNEMGILSHKDVRYNDEKDKKKVINTYEKDYENYIDDYKNKTICFFNRLGANKYKKPTKIEFETENNKPEKLIVADITEDKVEYKDLNKEIEENNRTIFDYPSNSMKKIILKQNRNKYKYHKVDTRERRIIFSNQEII